MILPFESHEIVDKAEEEEYLSLHIFQEGWSIAGHWTRPNVLHQLRHIVSALLPKLHPAQHPDCCKPGKLYCRLAHIANQGYYNQH